MRNTILITIFIVFGTNSLMSQPTLIAGNSNPYISLQYMYYQTLYQATPDPAGFYSWDFSEIKAIDTLKTRYYGHGGVPGDSLFKLSNISRNTVSGYIFYKTDETKQSIAGVNDSLNYVYTNLADLIRYPFTYQNKFTDTFYCHYIRGNDTISRTGTVTVEAKSYGNLKLPYATINNVLGIKRFEAFNDVTNSGNEYHEISSYSWHVPGVALPILSMVSEDFKGKLTQSGSYISKESLGIEQKYKNQTEMRLLDDPGKDLPVIQLNLSLSTEIQIKCVSLSGVEIFNEHKKIVPAGLNFIRLPDYDLIPGIYLMNVSVNGFSISKRFMVIQ
jgi:hypothetical protein